MIACNVKSLRYLRVGFESLVVESYANSRDSVSDAMQRDNSTKFGEVMKRCKGSDNRAELLLRLARLQVDGFDFHYLIEGRSGLRFDFSCLRCLAMTSCCGLVEAFAILQISKTGSRNTSGVVGSLENLNSFKLRHERTSTVLQSQLETFLTSLRPLGTLQVILEGCSKPQDLTSILKIHGPRLQILVWDERSGKRSTALHTTSIGHSAVGRLRNIAMYCRRLKYLGLSLPWETIATKKQWRYRVTPKGPQDFVFSDYSLVALCLNCLRDLRALNIRNMPKVSSLEFPIPMEDMCKSLATMVMNEVAKSPGCTRRLRNIALGALTYSDLRIGAGFFPPGDLRDFL